MKVIMKLYNFFKKAGLKTRIITIVMLLLLILTIVLLIQFRITLHAELSRQIERNAVCISEDLAARSSNYLLTNNLYELYRISKETMNNYEDIAYVFFQNNTGEVLVHTFENGFPDQLSDINQMENNDNNVSIKIFNTTGGLLRDVAVPVIQGQEETLRVGFLDNTIREDFAGVARQILISAVIVFTLSGFLLFILITLTTTKPLYSLMESIQSVSEGNYTKNVEVNLNAGGEIQKIATTFNDMTKHLDEERKKRNLLMERITTTQEEERKRIAGEIHDETGQALASLMIAAHLIEKEKNPDIIKNKAGEFHNKLRGVVKNLRMLIWQMSPIPLRDQGLKAALESFIAKLSDNNGWHVVLNAKGLDSGNLQIPYEVEIAIYRVIQEALTNIAKHANASLIELDIIFDNHQMEIQIKDNGIGFEPEEKTTSAGESLGIASMKERILSMEGGFKIESSPGNGTVIKFNIPASKFSKERMN